jgi:hypothetical protein
MAVAQAILQAATQEGRELRLSQPGRPRLGPAATVPTARPLAQPAYGNRS